MAFNYVKSIIFIVFLCLLCGCVSDIKEKLKLSSKIDDEKVIEQQKEQVAKTIKSGPQINKVKERDIEDSRKRINDGGIDNLSINFFNTNNNKLFLNIKDADIRALAEIFSRISNKNIVVGKEVDTTIRVRLDNIYISSAFDTITSSHGLYQIINTESSILSIHNADTATAIVSSGTDKIQRKTIKSVTEVFRIHYADLEMLKKNILEIFNNGESPESNNTNNLNISIDERTRSLIVNGSPNEMNRVSSIIEALDKRTNVVLIEAIIVVAKDTFSEALGARLGLTRDANTLASGLGGASITDAAGNAALTDASGTPSQLAVGNTSGTLSNNLPSAVSAGVGIITGIGDINRLKLEIAALESENLSRVLSNPRIFTMDNTTASISKGDEIPYVNTTSQNGATVEFVDAALKLEVTPSVVGDGNVILKIQLNNDTADTSQSNPPISRTEINTTLLVQSGEIVVIGGTTVDDKSQTNSGVPYLKDLPLIGELFTGVSNSDKLTELMIFICPVVL